MAAPAPGSQLICSLWVCQIVTDVLSFPLPWPTEMTGKAFILLLAVQVALGQHSTNSLQDAIEALHRHHEILSSQQNARHQHSPAQLSRSQVDDYFADGE